MIGEFEYLVLSATARLGDNAYGAAVRRTLCETGRPTSIGALYTTIDRLEQKGLLKTWMGDATPKRGGRAKRMMSITHKGVGEAKAFYEAVLRASRDLSWVTE